MKLFYKEKLSDDKRIIHILGLKITTQKTYDSKTKDIIYESKIGFLKFKSIKKHKNKKINLSKITRGFKKDAILYVKPIKNLFSKLNTVETIVLGSSCSRGGVIEDEKIANLSIDSQDLYYSYMLYDKYKKIIPNLKNVVIFYSVFSPGHELEKSPHAHRCAYYKFFYDIPYKNKLLLINKDVIEFEKKLIQTKTCVKNNLASIPCDIMGFGGYAPLDESEIERFCLNELKTRSKNQANQYLKFLVEDCLKNSINVFIVLAARNPRSHKYYPAVEELFNYAFELQKQYKNAHIINMFNSKIFDKDDFYDLTHVNLKGAKKLTDAINKEIEGTKNCL